MFDVILVTENGFVFSSLSEKSLKKIHKAVKTHRVFRVLVELADGRAFYVSNILLHYDCQGGVA